MRAIRSFGLVVAALLCALPAASQASAGRVLIAVGDVVAVRDGRPFPLQDGSMVESGDLIRLGERSSAQLQMVDKAVFSLRANTEMKLDAYVYDPQGTANKSFFSLFKGGLRAITGLIGKQNRENYKFVTPTSTIGIRGTHFSVVQCNGNCFNADGSKAADGLFGGVTDGRVAVQNAAGEKEFRKNEYFFVASQETLVKPLSTPPSFLRDPQEARGRPKAAAAASSDDKTVAKGDSKPDEVAPAAQAAVAPEPAAPVAPAAAPSAASTAAPVTALVTAPANNQPVVLGVAFSVAEAFANASTSIGQENTGFGQPPFVQTTRAVPVLEYRLSVQDWTTVDSTPISNPDGSTTAQTTTIHLTKTASVNVGSSPDAGNVTWGQYLLTTEFTVATAGSPTQTSAVTRTRHWAIGDGVSAMPTSGSFTYNWVGGTTPTDTPFAVAGGTAPPPNVGILTSGGAIGVRFDNQTMSTLAPITWSMPQTGSAYSVSFQNQSWAPTITTTNDSTTGTSNRNAIYPTFTATGSSCTNCTNLNVSVAPVFYGVNARGLGLGIGTQATVQGKPERTSTVQVYKR